MTRYENRCVDCEAIGLHCEGDSCELRRCEVWYCDRCGCEIEDGVYDGDHEDLCEICYEDLKEGNDDEDRI